MLPIYRTGFAHQHDDFGLTADEIVAAFQRVTDLWLEMEGDLQVRPIQDYVTNVLRWYAGGRYADEFYDRQSREVLFIVDTNGNLYSNADAYDAALCYGNVFTTSLFSLHQSDNYLRARRSRYDRIARTCGACRFHAACSGFFCGRGHP
ncbi:MAG: hypothetical protein ACXWCX_23210 [Burkholderiales bacterium]